MTCPNRTAAAGLPIILRGWMIYQLADDCTTRPATAEDAEQVAVLWNRPSEVTRGRHRSTPERVLSHWTHPKFTLSTDSRLVFAPDGELIGYAHIRDITRIHQSTSSAAIPSILTTTAERGCGMISSRGWTQRLAASFPKLRKMLVSSSLQAHTERMRRNSANWNARALNTTGLSIG